MMRSSRRVDDFSLKDHSTNLTLTHFNLNLKYKTNFGSKHGEKERRQKQRPKKNVRLRGSYDQEEREREKKKKNKKPQALFGTHKEIGPIMGQSKWSTLSHKPTCKPIKATSY